MKLLYETLPDGTSRSHILPHSPGTMWTVYLEGEMTTPTNLTLKGILPILEFTNGQMICLAPIRCEIYRTHFRHIWPYQSDFNRFN